jgi:hypothetical protein
MAGDWIKMRHDLGSDPAVIRIRRATGLDADSIVGKLHRIWVWADLHTTDGSASGVDVAWVDEYVGVDGFGAAMVDAGWLEDTGRGIRIINFDRHNGAPAKVRAQGKTRAKRFRNAASVTESDEERYQRREEKRREEEHARAGGKPPKPGAGSTGPEPAADGDPAAATKPAARPRRPGWVHDAWARIVEVWNATDRAVPWTLATPPNGFADLAASPGWVAQALAAVAMLPECRRFERPVPWTQFVRDLDRIIAGEFRDPRDAPRQLAAAGGRPQRRGNL